MTQLFPAESLSMALAYALGVFVAALPIHFIVALTWELVEVEAISDEPFNELHIHSQLRRYVWQGDLVGVVERSLYLTALLLGRAEFVAIWLTLKTVGRSPRWTEEKATRGRGLFNNFLIGIGLPILLAFAGEELATMFAGHQWAQSTTAAWAMLGTVAVLSVVTSVWLCWRLDSKWSKLIDTVPDEVYLKLRGKERGTPKRVAPAQPLSSAQEGHPDLRPTRLPPQGERALASHLRGHRIEDVPATPRGHPGPQEENPGQAVRPPWPRAGEAVRPTIIRRGLT